MILVSGVTATHRRYAATGLFGHLVTPSGQHRMGPIVAGGLDWACDNDFFWKPDPDAFRKMLDKAKGHPRCRFVTCPDVVGDATATLESFGRWQPEVAASGLPVALVGQDGLESLDVPWDCLDALFIGGSTGWKESRAAMRLCDQAKTRGKWVHVGRVNTFRRLKKVFDWKCVDSIDGTCFSKFPEVYFPWFIGKLCSLEAQPLLWGHGPCGEMSL